MRQRAFSLALVALLSLCLGLIVAGAEAKFGRLEGHVTRQGDNIPLSNVTIEVVGYGETRTDHDGKYVFDKLPVGSYQVKVKSSELSEPQSKVTIRANRTTTSNFSVVPLANPRP